MKRWNLYFHVCLAITPLRSFMQNVRMPREFLVQNATRRQSSFHANKNGGSKGGLKPLPLRETDYPNRWILRTAFRANFQQPWNRQIAAQKCSHALAFSCTEHSCDRNLAMVDFQVSFLSTNQFPHCSHGKFRVMRITFLCYFFKTLLQSLRAIRLTFIADRFFRLQNYKFRRPPLLFRIKKTPIQLPSEHILLPTHTESTFTKL